MHARICPDLASTMGTGYLRAPCAPRPPMRAPPPAAQEGLMCFVAVERSPLSRPSALKASAATFFSLSASQTNSPPPFCTTFFCFFKNKKLKQKQKQKQKQKTYGPPYAQQTPTPPWPRRRPRPRPYMGPNPGKHLYQHLNQPPIMDAILA